MMMQSNNNYYFEQVYIEKTDKALSYCMQLKKGLWKKKMLQNVKLQSSSLIIFLSWKYPIEKKNE